MALDSAPRRPAPVSTRHALALAFDLAVRRDPLHSLLVPLLLRGPWILAIAIMPAPGLHESAGRLTLGALALLGDLVAALLVGAMLRVRARSVFNADREARPAPAAACYAAGMRRVPWLFVTEAMRNFAFALAFVPPALAGFDSGVTGDRPVPALLLLVSLLFVAPALFVLYRLGVATEAVVLDARDLAGAFQISFARMRGRFERWLELVAAGGVLVLAPVLGMTLLWLAVPGLSWTTSVAFMWLLVAAVWPVLQYAWTFFYLRLVEVDPVREGGATLMMGAEAGSSVSPSNG